MNQYTIKEIIELNKEAGGYFFDEKTMDFWGSKVESEPIRELFVTSEDNFDRTKKLYTVRRFNPDDCSIDTYSAFQQFETLQDAMNFIHEVA